MRSEGDITPVGKIISEKYAFNHPFFQVVERVVQSPDGEVREPQLLWDRGSRRFAIAYVVTSEGQVVVVREPKYGQMDLFHSLPAGGVRKDEEPLSAAKRETLEETGYECEKWFSVPGEPLVDFADKIDGGEHYVFLGLNARQIQKPEENNRVVVLMEPRDLRKNLRIAI